MPRRRTPFEDIVREVAANHEEWGPERIREHLLQALAASGQDREEFKKALPSLSTIGRIKARFPPDERGEYRYVRWPETFEAGLLPWEASGLLLDVTALYERVAGVRPTVRVARWYWRTSLIAPEVREYVRALNGADDQMQLSEIYGDDRRMEMNHLVAAPRVVAAQEALNGELPEDVRRGLEGWLATRAWLEAPGEHMREGRAYHRELVEHGAFPDWSPISLSIGFDAPDERAMNALADFFMYSPEAARRSVEYGRGLRQGAPRTEGENG